MLYSDLLPGSQLAGRLQELGYRVQSISDRAALRLKCEEEKPLVLLVEVTRGNGACEAVAQLKSQPGTAHIPVLGFAATQDKALEALAQQSGLALLVGRAALLEHLPLLLDRALQLD